MSVAVHGSLVAVVNAENGGSVQEYIAFLGHLFPLPGSNRALGLDPKASPQFVNTPGQVAFSPDGSKLIVTTKANGNNIDVFRVGFLGLLSAFPVVNSEPGTVPFAITFDQTGHLVIANAGTNALSTFALNPNGTVNVISSVGTGNAATCWVAPAQGFLFASNAGSANVSGFQSSAERSADASSGQPGPTPGPSTRPPRAADSSSTSRPEATESLTSSRSTPTEPSPPSDPSPSPAQPAEKASSPSDQSSVSGGVETLSARPRASCPEWRDASHPSCVRRRATGLTRRLLKSFNQVSPIQAAV